LGAGIEMDVIETGDCFTLNFDLVVSGQCQKSPRSFLSRLCFQQLSHPTLALKTLGPHTQPMFGHESTELAQLTYSIREQGQTARHENIEVQRSVDEPMVNGAPFVHRAFHRPTELTRDSFTKSNLGFTSLPVDPAPPLGADDCLGEACKLLNLYNGDKMAFEFIIIIDMREIQCRIPLGHGLVRRK
jgi:hypothetical protein